MKENEHSWSRSFRNEIKWAKKLKKSNELIKENNIEYPSILRQRVIIIFTLLLSLLPHLKYFRGSKKYITIGFSLEISGNYKYDFIESKINLHSFVLGIALQHFLGLHYLLVYKYSFNEIVRKLLIRVLLKLLLREINSLRKYTFIVSQDYFGRSSCLVSFMDDLNIKVIGLQHGLMPFENIQKSYIYPGFRLPVQLIYNKNYDIIFKSNNPIPVYKILGPSWDIERRNFHGKISVCYVSNGLMHEVSTKKTIEHLELTCKKLGYSFQIRPHPQELKNISSKIPINACTKKNIIDSKIHYIFIGVYSTFLYWAIFNGFKTIWIRDMPCGLLDEQMISKLPNVFFIDKELIINTPEIKNIIDIPYVEFINDNLGERLRLVLDEV